jgi:YD repeat-containing protein
MARPVGILTRRVTFGPAHTLALGADLAMAVQIKPSTSLVWAATGAPLIGMMEPASAEPGMQGYMDLPLPGQPGFIDGNGNEVKDFTYRAEVTYLQGGRVVGDGMKVFTLLEGEGDVDLDTMIPLSSNAGVTVSIPDSWTRDVAEATRAVAAAKLLVDEFPESDTLPRYIDGELQTPFGFPIELGPDEAALLALDDDPESQLRKQQDARQIATFAESYPDATTITYDGAGNVATVTESGLTTTYTYNGDGSVATDSRVVGGVTTARA